MEIALCAAGADGKTIRETLADWSALTGRALSLAVFSRREDLLYSMRARRYDAVFLALRGGYGMETAIGVRQQDPDVPLVWVSDDRELAIQSYRLRTSLFLVSPVEPPQVIEGLGRCQLEGAGC